MWKRYIYYLKFTEDFNAPDRPVISNGGFPTQKVSYFFDNHLKVIMQESWFQIKDLNDFINKTKNLKDIPKDALLIQ